jgi:hypothetical protein
MDSVTITTDTLSYFTNVSNRLMFKIKNHDLYILDSSRVELFAQGPPLTKDDTVEVFSSSVIKELLNDGKSSATQVENRKDVLTITNGTFTLEQGIGCPPWCN